MDAVQTILLGVLCSNALFTFIQFLITRHDEKKETPTKKALLALCSERLESMLRKWVTTDYHTIARWATIKALFDAYTALGGNGEIKALYAIAEEIKPSAEKGV